MRTRFTIFDKLAFYEHPDETWSSAQAVMFRGDHWIAISTPGGGESVDLIEEVLDES